MRKIQTTEGSRLLKLANLVFTILLLIGISQICFSQNETGVRQIYKTGCQYLGIWYDSNTAMFQERYPIIRSIPPISTDMPYNILMGYIYADSLMRCTTPNQTDSLIKSWTSLNDTLKYAIKYLYELEDYNPVIFRQYCDELWWHQRPTVDSGAGYKVVFEDGFTMPNGSEPHIPTYLAVYRNDLLGLVSKLNVKFAHVIPNESERAALFSLSEAQYVLRVRILSASDSVPNKYVAYPPNQYRYQVTAEVLDTIKGRVFNSYGLSGPDAISMPNSANPIIKIQYSPKDYWIIDEETDFGIIYPNPDSSFLDQSIHSMHSFKFTPNQECIVFMVNESRFVDSTADYYDFITEPRASAAALPIINGQVRDVNHIWSSETYLPYSEWRNRIEALINKIRTMNY